MNGWKYSFVVFSENIFRSLVESYFAHGFLSWNVTGNVSLARVVPTLHCKQRNIVHVKFETDLPKQMKPALVFRDMRLSSGKTGSNNKTTVIILDF